MSAIDSFILPPFRKAPEPVKYIILAGEAYAIYAGIKFAKKKLFPSDEQKTVNAAKTEADEILKNNLKLPPEQRLKASFSPSQMKTFADTLFSAMDGSGTDEDALDGVFKEMKNDLDILLLIDAFGTRTGSSIFASSTPANLADWLQSDGVTTRVNDLLKTKASISKRF